MPHKLQNKWQITFINLKAGSMSHVGFNLVLEKLKMSNFDTLWCLWIALRTNSSWHTQTVTTTVKPGNVKSNFGTIKIYFRFLPIYFREGEWSMTSKLKILKNLMKILVLWIHIYCRIKRVETWLVWEASV